MNRIMSEPVNQIALKHRQTLLDSRKLKREQAELDTMLQQGLDDILDKFPIIEKKMGTQPRSRIANAKFGKDTIE